ncbi:hypothetical protein [Pseudomonas viridiflava]|uniref:hypothetical protein n=1 Tax=Pseudomonas viridiflava TaxID=33069 RepID=UPI001E5E5AF3|nr:hypothetical protein [Pseudomonas viridiflava]
MTESAANTNVVDAATLNKMRADKAASPAPELTAASLAVGRTYRAKRPAMAGGGFSPFINDRTIVWMNNDASVVQYDGPSVANGRRYPKVTAEAFLKWASHDVTDQLPNKEYAPWPKKNS